MVYLGRFFTSLAFNIPWVVFSSFLATRVPEESVGMFFVIASVVATVLIIEGPRLLRQWGIKHAIRSIAIGEIAALLLLAIPQLPLGFVILGFVAASTLPYLIYLGLDILLQTTETSSEHTGQDRGLFLISTNLAYVLATLSVGLFVIDSQYGVVFVLAAIVMTAVAMLAGKFSSVSSVMPDIKVSWRDAKKLLSNPSLLGITVAYLLLQMFGTWMAIYVPLYLHDHAQLPWYAIGIIFAVSALPYVFFEFPLGFIADTWLGEKEILITGLVTLAVGTALISVADGHIIPILLVLLIARTGAAMVESMCETYFFKKVKAEEGETISVFRAMQPVSSIVAPLIGSLALLAVPLTSAFFIFGVIILLGIPFALPIKDTL